MTGQNVGRAWEQLPKGDQRTLRNAKKLLDEISPVVRDEVFGILCGRVSEQGTYDERLRYRKRFAGTYAVLATSQRLIIVAAREYSNKPSPQIEVIKYSVVRCLEFESGRAGFFRSKNWSLRVDGTEFWEFPLAKTSVERANAIGARVVAACEPYLRERRRAALG